MSKIGNELLKWMEALAHAQGKRSRARVHELSLEPADIQKARKKLGLSQDRLRSPSA